MPRYRFYINHKITDSGGGDPSRVVDIDADSDDHARELLQASDHPLSDNEDIEQINEIHLTPPVPDPEIDWQLSPIPPPGV